MVVNSVIFKGLASFFVPSEKGARFACPVLSLLFARCALAYLLPNVSQGHKKLNRLLFFIRAVGYPASVAAV